VKRNGDLVVVVGWSLLAGLVRAVLVVVAGVLARDGLQVAFAVDEHPVGALAADPSFGETVRARRLWWGLRYLQAFAGEDRAEDAGEVGVAVSHQEAEGADPVTEVRDQIASLLGRPFAVGMSGHAQDVHSPGPRPWTPGSGRAAVNARQVTETVGPRVVAAFHARPW
jgi:hypothetical protein